MSIKTSHYITRATALAVMFSKLQEIDNESLADMLEDFPESHFRNYRIITEEDMKELDEFKAIRTIKTVNEF